MKEAGIIYPHQLGDPQTNPVLDISRPVYLVEEPLLLNYNPSHRQRLLLNRLSMQDYAAELSRRGFTVHYLDLRTIVSSDDVWQRLAADGVTSVHVADTSDDYLEQALGRMHSSYGIERIWYESPLFLLSRSEATQRYQDSGRHMARFYQRLRTDWHILVTEDGRPAGGAWSFDSDNRKKLPRDLPLPPDIAPPSQGWPPEETRAIEDSLTWLSEIGGQQYGHARIWLGWTRAAADQALDRFLAEGFASFGSYEDALTRKHRRLFHSTLSPYLNTGLLDPRTVLETAIGYAHQHQIPMNSLEGFVRQILGWREFMRAAYEQDGRVMRTRNSFAHSLPLPDSLWTAESGIAPLDHAIDGALAYGYSHHIERLMVLGNWMLLTESHPDQVYRWFMGMYVDAYDWVMVPNVYGMSQFADGGIFATKPYISGSNYLRKMSDYPPGKWEKIWTALYWRFISRHRKLFESNPRMAMMPRMLDRMNQTTREEHMQGAADFLSRYR